MKNIIFLDIDGTIIDVPRGLSEPSYKTKYAINELMKNGNLVFIASGRFKGNIPLFLKDLNVSGYILSNGALIEYDKKIIYSKEFDKEKFKKIIDYCIKNDSLFTGETYDHMYAPTLDNKLKDFLHKWKLDYVKIQDDMANDIFYKCCTNFKTKEIAMDFEKQFKGLVDYRAQTADPEGLSYDINDLGVNKGSAVDVLIDKLGIDRNNTYCFCDGTNDLELVKACKNSYVMANGDEGLKKIAYGIAKDVIDDGVYHKLVELNLIKKMD